MLIVSASWTYFVLIVGFNMQKRPKVERIGIEGNYFPITSMAYIQDVKVRLSLLTNHAQGAASWQPGYLEVMLDRRTLYDDSRGMGEGLVDNQRTIMKYWLLIEDRDENTDEKRVAAKRFENTDDTDDVIRSFNIPTESVDSGKREDFSMPSLYAVQLSQALNYPAMTFIVESEHQSNINGSLSFINRQFSCDTHLLTFRTLPDSVYPQFPSASALLVLHRQGYNFDCK